MWSQYKKKLKILNIQRVIITEGCDLNGFSQLAACFSESSIKRRRQRKDFESQQFEWILHRRSDLSYVKCFCCCWISKKKKSIQTFSRSFNWFPKIQTIWKTWRSPYWWLLTPLIYSTCLISHLSSYSAVACNYFIIKLLSPESIYQITNQPQDEHIKLNYRAKSGLFLRHFFFKIKFKAFA